MDTGPRVGAGRRYVIWALGLGFAGCAVLGQPSPGQPEPDTPFERLYALAEAGDAESQNLIGFMLFFGEMAPRSRPIARHWFEAAARQGHMSAQLNMAVVSFLGAGMPQDRGEALRYFEMARASNARSPGAAQLRAFPASLESLIDQACSTSDVQVTTGERTFITFCAGCHGLNGIAAYAGAPSFAFGERMEKSDGELFTTIVRGHEVMPGWGDKLGPELLASALDFARTLEAELGEGVLHQLRRPPETYYLFGPMAWADEAYRAEATEYEENFDALSRMCP